MEASLTDHWIGAEDPIFMRDDASVSAARQRARAVAAGQSMTRIDSERLATIASELGYNQLRHGRRGRMVMRPISRGEHLGVEVVAADEGDGILDPTRALEGVARGTGSLGIGMAAVREHADELDIDVRIREGTCVQARVFSGEAPLRREVGIFGRPYRDEPRSGDHACFLRPPDRLLVAVCDGLGHGPHARTAADIAIDAFRGQENAPARAIIEGCHRALHGTRGAVMAVVAVTEGGSRSLDLAAVGNITVELADARSSRRFGAKSFVLGSPSRAWQPQVEVARATPEETLILYTDGIVSAASLRNDPSLLREHPIVIAHQLVERFARDDDDVLVLVAR